MTKSEIKAHIAATKSWADVYMIVDYLLNKNDLLEDHCNELIELLNKSLEQSRSFHEELKEQLSD